MVRNDLPQAKDEAEEYDKWKDKRERGDGIILSMKEIYRYMCGKVCDETDVRDDEKQNEKGDQLRRE